ncbi:hypothetical protein ACLHDG_06615 [Sulfurovum sp. CS9]|uniref:hypothetical protein n=1 Tax=Sulfurovum sp. CS9 TaxID=3391146 RepID=UPI0039EBEC10
MKLILAIIIYTNLLFATTNADIDMKISVCANKKNDKKRLICFDKLSKQEVALKENKVKSTTSPKKVLKKNERIEKLINTDSNIEKVYKNILFTHLMKDKFESTKEYKARLDNPKFNTYAIMEQSGKKQYNADKKLYKVCFDGPESTVGFGNQYFRGDESTKYIGRSDAIKPKKYDLAISFEDSYKESTVVMRNNFGVATNVKKRERTSFAIHPNNLKSVMKMKNIFTTVDKDKSFSTLIYRNTCINIPADKESAKELDKHKYMIKMGVTFLKIRTHLYSDSHKSEATISNPESYFGETWGFDGHINEFVVYNIDTREILFQYTD